MHRRGDSVRVGFAESVVPPRDRSRHWVQAIERRRTGHGRIRRQPDGEVEQSPRQFRQSIRRSLITGTALTIPFIVTLIVLGVVLDFVSRTLNPVVDRVEYFQLGWVPDLVVEASTLLTLFTIVLVVGIVAEHTESDRVTGGIHAAMEAIPGVGSIYNGFRRMSDVLVESDTDSFQEVKLVEFPHEGTFSLGYLTGHPAETIREAAGHERMRTVFMPLAPNPVMGGFLVYLPEERIRDIDMTIEESVQAIVTSGVATSASSPDAESGPHEENGLDERA